jgi:ATP-dependent exoDNAse (exonuclease V) beta subunit
VLPESLKRLFTQAGEASSADATIWWSSASGRRFEWHICRAASESPTSSPGTQPAGSLAGAAATCRDDEFGLCVGQAPLRRSVTEWLRESDPDDPSDARVGDSTSGILVHRLLQSGLPEHLDEAPARAFTRQLLQPQERAAVPDIEPLVTTALATWRALRRRPDVAALLTSGRVLHEVPFSLGRAVSGDRLILRGTIDCLVHTDDGSVVVLEFKTGRPRSSHQRQLNLYVEAAAALYPAARVEGRLIYAD